MDAMTRDDRYLFAIPDDAAQHVCLNRSPLGFLCDKPSGHDGDHQARDGETGELFDIWPDQLGESDDR
jgi:hypothetical protein